MDMKQKIEQLVAAALKRGSLDLNSGGALPAETLKEFLKTTGGEGTPLITDINANNCMPIFIGDTYKIPNIGIAARQLQKATAETAPTAVATITSGEGEIDPVEVIFPIDIPYELFEDAVGRTLEEKGEIAANKMLDQTIGDLAIAAFMRDVQDLLINGDTGSQTTFLKTLDGLVKVIDDNGTTYDPSDAETITEHLKGLIASADPNIRGRKKELTIYMNSDDFAELAEVYEQKNTPLGDTALTADNEGNLRYHGIVCKELDHLPNQKNLLGFSKAFWLGFKRDVSIEKMRQPRKRIVEMTMTARFGCCAVYPYCVLGTRKIA